jgi:hypothetical protein
MCIIVAARRSFDDGDDRLASPDHHKHEGPDDDAVAGPFPFVLTCHAQ